MFTVKSSRRSNICRKTCWGPRLNHHLCAPTHQWGFSSSKCKCNGSDNNYTIVLLLLMFFICNILNICLYFFKNLVIISGYRDALSHPQLNLILTQLGLHLYACLQAPVIISDSDSEPSQSTEPVFQQWALQGVALSLCSARPHRDPASAHSPIVLD